MVNGVQLKVCGLTREEDARHAAAMGADYLGFVLHPASPRYLSLENFAALRPKLPALPTVGVLVYSDDETLARVVAAGFDFVQVHFSSETALSVVDSWAKTVSLARLWLAPRLPPGSELDHSFLPMAETFLLDAYHPQQHGGTGKTGDWEQFVRLQKLHSHKRWILAGGLNPTNITTALRQTHARIVDVNSGVESAPGLKDATRLRDFVAGIAAAQC